MANISKIYPLLFIIPFISVLACGYFLDAFPKDNIVVKVMNIITEKDMALILERNGLDKKWVKRFPYIRIGVSFAIALMVFIIKRTPGQFIIAMLILAGFYKFIYLYYQLVDRQRIKKLNQNLPYLMKSLIYLMQPYNAHDAIEKAYEYVNTSYKYDLKILAEETFENPRSYDPYQHFVDRYEGKIVGLDRYLKSIYRLSNSASSKEVAKYMTILNETISHDVSLARKEKNDTVNKTIQYIGFIPVVLSTIMIIVIMVLSISAI